MQRAKTPWLLLYFQLLSKKQGHYLEWNILQNIDHKIVLNKLKIGNISHSNNRRFYDETKYYQLQCLF